MGRLLHFEGPVARVVALAEVEHQTVHVTLPGRDASAGTPQSVVDYVQRTGERVLLRDARSDAVFGRDPAIAERGVRSLLAQPIVRHSAVVGVLLLEHRLVTDAFTPQRLTALEGRAGTTVTAGEIR